MAKIILKGTDVKIECANSLAEQINKMKENKTDPKTLLTVSGSVVELGDIRYALKDGDMDKQLISDDTKKENNEYYAQSIENYKKDIEKKCLMNVEDKSNNTKLFETLFFGVTGKRINQSQKDYVVKIQREYFLQNKNHPFAKVNYFKLLKELPENNDSYNMEYHTGSATLRVVRRIIEEGFATAYEQKYI